MSIVRVSLLVTSSLWATRGAEIQLVFAENPKLSKIPSFEPTVDENIALHASPAARNYAILTAMLPHFIQCVWFLLLLLLPVLLQI